MARENNEAGRGRHLAPAPEVVSADVSEYSPAFLSKQANLLADWSQLTWSKAGTRALQPRAARSKIVKLARVFRPRLEIKHRQSTSSEGWIFAFEYVGEKGRQFVGKFEDVAIAFNVARAFRDLGVRIAFIERRQP